MFTVSTVEVFDLRMDGIVMTIFEIWW